ncbi:MAG TPA: DUF4157 domain-containing protein [Baekduia sp.]|nr:DUF4157 domain-containing protein [Baekduia sp.]
MPGATRDRRAVTQLAAAVGNRAFAQLARAGAGILADGRVHPEVQAAIDASRGAGAPLDAATRAGMGAALGDAFTDVRVHADRHAGDLARAVDARAFTTGSDIYFAPGAYQPGQPEGDQLLAHELTHVVQQRGSPTSGPMTVTQPGDAQEREAEAVARELGG